MDRRKIESTVSTVTPEYGYFEKHLRYVLKEEELEKFFELLKGNEVKISYNSKHIGVVPLLTLKSKRDIECLETFTRRFEAFEKMMSNNGFYPVKSMLERCWLDDNYGYDDIWSYA